MTRREANIPSTISKYRILTDLKKCAILKIATDKCSGERKYNKIWRYPLGSAVTGTVRKSIEGPPGFARRAFFDWRCITV